MLKCLILTLVCAVVIIVSLLAVIIVMASFSSNTIPKVIENNTSSGRGTNCFLEVNGELKKSVMLTETSALHQIYVYGSKLCKLRFLAVGGGGKGYYSGGGQDMLIMALSQFNQNLICMVKHPSLRMWEIRGTLLQSQSMEM